MYYLQVMFYLLIKHNFVEHKSNTEVGYLYVLKD
jgi:hypothetical protein